MTPTNRRGLLMLAPLAAGAALVPAAPRAQAVQTIADTLAANPQFSRFLDMLTRASAVETFRQAAPMTVFAPVDAAFAGAPAGILQDLLGRSGSGQNTGDAERQRLMALINYHIVPGLLSPAELAGSERRLRTVNGADLVVSTAGSTLSLANPAPGQQMGSFGAAGFQVNAGPAEVVGSPIRASNGVIYPVNRILWP